MKEANKLRTVVASLFAALVAAVCLCFGIIFGLAQNSAANIDELSITSDDVASGTLQSASGDVAQIGSTTYATIKAAFTAANTSGGTVKLIADAESKETLVVEAGSAFTLDLNGYVLRYTGAGNLRADDMTQASVLKVIGELVLEDSNNQKENSITDPSTGEQVTIEGGIITGGKGSVIARSLSTYTLKEYVGGGIVVYGGKLTINGGNISGNTIDCAASNVYGGGVYITKNGDNIGKLVMNDGSISYNTAANSGGGVEIMPSCSFIMNDGNISYNTASSYGGGLYVSDDGIFRMIGGMIAENKANKGGGLYSLRGDCEISGGRIYFNTAVEYGGGIFCYEFKISNAEISHNTARAGGGLYVNSAVEITNATINGNNALSETLSPSSDFGNGGGICVKYDIRISNAISSLESVNMAGNEADGQGGAICVKGTNGNSCTVILKGETVITANTSRSSSSYGAGGGIYTDNFGYVEISGKPYILSNTNADDENADFSSYMSRYNNLVIGKLEQGAKIGIYPYIGNSDSNKITTSYDISNGDPSQYFVLAYDNKRALTLYRIKNNETYDDYNVYIVRYLVKFVSSDPDLGKVECPDGFNSLDGFFVLNSNGAISISGTEISVKTTSGYLYGKVQPVVTAAGAQFTGWTINGQPFTTGTKTIVSGDYEGGLVYTLTANFKSPNVVMDVSVGNVIDTYTAGDTSVKLNLNRTLKNTETDEISNDTVEYTATVAPLHAGTQNVSFTYTYGTFSKALTQSINVAKKQVNVSWYYKGEATSVNSQKDYNGIDRRGEVEARYIGINGATVSVFGSNMKMTYNGAVASANAEFKNAGVYTFSLVAANPDDYEFLNNQLTFAVNKVGIDLTDETKYNWVLRSDKSELRTGNIYIYIVDGNPQYYYNEQSDLALYETKFVTRSIVRYRNMNLGIMLNGVDTSRTSVTYNNCDQKDVGPYVSYAYLSLVDAVNYYYVGGTLDASRGMTIQIDAEGKTAAITKNWYIVNISNGLLSQEQSTYGQEYDISDWTYGDDVTISAPRLEHGDDGAYQSIYPFSTTDNKVTFELYRRDIGSTGEFTKIGNKFNRNAFSTYINKSMPAGEYRLEASAAAVQLNSSNHTHWWNGEPETGNKLYFEAFTQEYTFTVAKAALGFSVNDGVKGKTYKYDYDGKLHLHKDDKISVTTTGAPTRTGVWKDAYNQYYDGGDATLTYNLNRWDNDIYRTEKELEDFTDDDSLRPVGVDEYKVYYRAALKNYVAYGDSECWFTVVIERVKYDLGGIKFEDESFVYDGDAHSISVTGAASFIKVEYVGNGKTDVGVYTVTAKLDTESDGYELVGDTELTATLTILAKTLEVVKGEESAEEGGELLASAGSDKGFEPDVKLSIVELHGYTNDKIKNVIDTAYEISLKSGDQTVEPVGAITIKLLIPEELRGEKFKILHVKTNTVETVAYAINGNYAVFTVNSLSPFVFVKTEEAPIALANTENNNNMWWIWVIVGAVALLIIILLLVLVFRKKNKQEVLPAPHLEAAPAANNDTADMATKIAEAAAIVAEAAAIVAEAKRAKANSTTDDETGVKVELAPEKIAAAPEPEKIAAAPAPKNALGPAQQLDIDDEITPEVDEDDTEVPSDDGFAGALEASSSETVTYSQSVLSKLLSSTDVVKNRYSELKNYLLSYKKARANMSRARESFYIGRNCYARIAVRGKTLCVYLALDPQKYAGTKYNVEDVLGVKSYADTPCLLRIKSERALKLAMELIDELMPTIGAEKYDRKPENYVALFKSIEMLQKKKLISCNGNKKKN